MGRIQQIVVLVVLVCLAGVSVFLIRTYDNAGEFTTLRPLFDGECQRLEGFFGVEDMVLDPETRIVYGAGENRRALRAGEPSRGAIYAIPLDEPARAEPLDLSDGAPDDFHPLGVDLHIDADGVRRLFVVNRADAGHRVDIFRLEGTRFSLERSIADPELHNANDVLALGPDRAYVTIDKRAETGSFGEIIEGALRRRNGRVLLVSPDEVTEVAAGLSYANGIALSEDGETLYVAETIARALRFYDRDVATDALSLRRTGILGTGVDNITIDEEGRLFIAAHPKLITFARGHAAHEGRIAPSQVIMVDPAAQEVDQVYLNLGEEISGSAVGLVDVEARRMLIGAIYEPHILSCALPEVWRHSEAYPASRPVNARPRD